MLCESSPLGRSTEPAHRLNPCSNGRCSASRHRWAGQRSLHTVLILVLMEDALREDGTICDSYSDIEVLILVLMEDALRVIRASS